MTEPLIGDNPFKSLATGLDLLVAECQDEPVADNLKSCLSALQVAEDLYDRTDLGIERLNDKVADAAEVRIRAGLKAWRERTKGA